MFLLNSTFGGFFGVCPGIAFERLLYLLSPPIVKWNICLCLCPILLICCYHGQVGYIVFFIFFPCFEPWKHNPESTQVILIWKLTGCMPFLFLLFATWYGFHKKNRLGVYFPQRQVESSFWNAPQRTCWNNKGYLEWLRSAATASQPECSADVVCGVWG